MRCMECGKEMKLTTAPLTEPYRGESFTVDGIEHYVCECGNVEMSSSEATKLAKALATQYAKARSLLSPDDIKTLRTDLGLTQREFESIMGVSKPTVSRWENGASQQSDMADRYMKAIRDVPAFRDYLGLSGKWTTATLNASLFSVIPGGKTPSYIEPSRFVDENSFKLEM